MKKPLTEKQKEVLDFLIKYNETYEIMPTLNEIKKKFKLSGESHALYYLMSLQKKGYITREKGFTRHIIIK